MSLNIKNQRVHDLARRAAAASGTTQTSAIEQALLEYLERLQGPARRDDTQRLLDQMHARLDDAARAKMLAASADLFDEQGLPR